VWTLLSAAAPRPPPPLALAFLEEAAALVAAGELRRPRLPGGGGGAPAGVSLLQYCQEMGALERAASLALGTATAAAAAAAPDAPAAALAARPAAHEALARALACMLRALAPARHLQDNGVYRREMVRAARLLHAIAFAGGPPAPWAGWAFDQVSATVAELGAGRPRWGTPAAAYLFGMLMEAAHSAATSLLAGLRAAPAQRVPPEVAAGAARALAALMLCADGPGGARFRGAEGAAGAPPDAPPPWLRPPAAAQPGGATQADLLGCVELAARLLAAPPVLMAGEMSALLWQVVFQGSTRAKALPPGGDAAAGLAAAADAASALAKAAPARCAAAAGDRARANSVQAAVVGLIGRLSDACRAALAAAEGAPAAQERLLLRFDGAALRLVRAATAAPVERPPASIEAVRHLELRALTAAACSVLGAALGCAGVVRRAGGFELLESIVEALFDAVRSAAQKIAPCTPARCAGRAASPAPHPGI
jgi:hypothetical protein